MSGEDVFLVLSVCAEQRITGGHFMILEQDFWCWPSVVPEHDEDMSEEE